MNEIPLYPLRFESIYPFSPFPLLLKLLDVRTRFSVQVLTP
jgi:hypothetical protein